MDLAKLVVGIGIALLLATFFSSAISTFYKAPTIDSGNYQDYAKDLEVYQLIHYLIVGFLSVIAIAIGFLMLDKESIGSGFIGAGVLGLLFGNVFAAISSVLSGFAALASMAGGSAKSSVAAALPYVNLIFLFIGLVVLIAFAYFKLEKPAR